MVNYVARDHTELMIASLDAELLLRLENAVMDLTERIERLIEHVDTKNDSTNRVVSDARHSVSNARRAVTEALFASSGITATATMQDPGSGWI